MREEFDYRKEQLIYYVALGRVKILHYFSSLSVIARIGLIFAAILALIGVGFVVINPHKPPPPPPKVVRLKEIVFPKLVGIEKNAAQKKLSDLGFTKVNVIVIPKYDDANGEQIILNQSPAAGSMFSPSDTASISYGSKTLYDKSHTRVSIPNIASLTLTEAEKQMRSLGFTTLKWVLPKGWNKDEVIVTQVDPNIGSSANLTDTISFTVSPGFEFDKLKSLLESQFVPYSSFSKVENTTGRSLKFTLTKRNNALNSSQALNSQALTYKNTIENIIGQPIEKVYLVNPGVNIVGDSSEAQLKNTNSGLTLAGAENACLTKANGAMPSFKIDWDSGLVQQNITADNITISGNGENQDANGNPVNALIHCVVSGTDSNPNIIDFKSN